MLDNQSTNLSATSFMVQPTSYIDSVMDLELSLPACQKADISAIWMFEHLFELSATVEGSLFFEDGCSTSRLMLCYSPTKRRRVYPRSAEV